MDRDEILATLRTHQPDLRTRGVLHAALFGSVARGDAGPDSDVDIMIELAPDATIGLFDYIGIKHYLADLIAAPVDVANRDTLKPHVRPRAEREAVYAF